MRQRQVVLLLALVACACGAATQKLRTQAAYDFRCPEDRLVVTPVAANVDGVEGCGQRASYVFHEGDWIMNSAPSDSRAAKAQPAASLTRETP